MTVANKSLESLDQRLAEKWMSGIWRIPAGARPGDPKTKVQPHLWKWADIYDGLVQARDQISLKSGTSERRTLRLVNPGVKESEMTSHTMLFAFQLIQPGEVAPHTGTRWPLFDLSFKEKALITTLTSKRW
jgi:gentisate 1,2-dioxygenase